MTKCGEAWSNELHFKKHLDSGECVLAAQFPFVCETCGKGWHNLTNYTKHIEVRECKSILDPARQTKELRNNIDGSEIQII